MKILIIYDTNFGNTQKVAYLIGEHLKEQNQVKVVSIAGFKNQDLDGIELLIMGSPINGWRPTEKIRRLLKSLKKDQLRGVKIATFDTRVNIFFHGNAAQPMAESLMNAGAEQIVDSAGFYVEGSEGPLAQGEESRVEKWVRDIKNHYAGI
jgi:flavodoxin